MPDEQSTARTCRSRVNGRRKPAIECKRSKQERIPNKNGRARKDTRQTRLDIANRERLGGGQQAVIAFHMIIIFRDKKGARDWRTRDWRTEDSKGAANSIQREKAKEIEWEKDRKVKTYQVRKQL